MKFTVQEENEGTAKRFWPSTYYLMGTSDRTGAKLQTYLKFYLSVVCLLEIQDIVLDVTLDTVYVLIRLL